MLTATCRTLEQDTPAESIGTVIKVHNGIFEVHGHGSLYNAQRAVSCLVEPEAGDLVVIKSIQDLNTSFVVDILMRPSSTDTRISTDGNLTLELGSGRFTVAGKKGIDLITEESISAIANRVDVRARDGNLLLSNATFVADALTTTLNRLTQTVKRVYRRVTEIEHVRAEQMDCRVNGNFRIHSENTLITARELVKADGKQIHMG